MTDRATIVVAVLAAGSSQRFGSQDKLVADFRGFPLGCHATRSVQGSDFDAAIVIASAADHPCTTGWRQEGFDIRINPHSESGMGSSVALAAQEALARNADALLIALADTPLVPTSHFQALVEAFGSGPLNTVIASSTGTTRMPPAIIGSAHFDDLASLSGDAGARALLQTADTIECPREWLIDIDTPEALAKWGRA